ncbi:hypothetical protein CISIN_1g005896mg [Citrus sinensis]|uniref:NB-ARC domain-containing protein n=1 Tax=Citrus sinensis TaxID=2711 RepID=A0A067DI59_CITSI|nr:hypothetical protein CISIN_1g005896mg [Citrus sinensis]
MAGGIIRQSRSKERLEDWGSKCFHDLVSRSIFQQTAISDSCKFVMHDLIHDLAELVSGETIFRLEEANTLSRRFERVRHSSYACGGRDGKNMFEVFNEIGHLRTFLPLRLRIRGGSNTSYITRSVLSDLLPMFKMLRMLSLQGYRIGELPIPFEDLRLLRFLNLADTDIRSLPESKCKLLNLEILILRNCSRLIKLPQEMRNLINLRHLDIRGAKLLKEMPFGMKELNKLQTLSNFIVGKGECASGLEDLKSLNLLCDELCIAGLENVNSPQNAREAALREKHNLEALTLEWGSQSDSPRDAVLEEKVLDTLQPHERIKELAIKHYGGARFPPWIGQHSFSEMKVLKLENCDNCAALPSLGLMSSLKILAVKGLKKLKSIESEVYGEGFSMPFPSLEILSFESLPEWQHWNTNIKGNEPVEIFPRLQELSIAECPQLSGELPGLLPSLETLVVRKCGKLVVPLSSYPMLCRLEVDECKELVDICGCDKLEALPNDMHKLNSLRDLGIQLCPNLVSFPEEGFPTNLTTLVIGNFKLYKTLVQWGLHRLTSLKHLWIAVSDDEAECFPDEEIGMTLPTSLTHLSFCGFQNLIFLSSMGFQNLTSLQYLRIGNCPNLTSFPEVGLPSSLLELHIYGCPNLKKACKRDQGKEWPKIAHIPFVGIDRKFIYDPEAE